MKSIAICLAPALLFAAGHATAAGPLLAGLQPRLSAAAPALATPALSALPGLQSTLNAGPALPALAATPLAGLESSEGSENDWLQYNLYSFRYDVADWYVSRNTHYRTSIQMMIAERPSPYNGCDASTCPWARQYAGYGANMLGLGNGAIGLSVKPTPPRPVMPSGMPFWLEYNYNYWPEQVVAWAAEKTYIATYYSGQALRDGAQYGAGAAVPSLTDGAIGLSVKPTPPKPVLPTDPT